MISLHGRGFKQPPSAVLGELLETKPGHKTPSNKANTVVIAGRVGPGQDAINGPYWLATSLHNDCPFYVKNNGKYFLYYASNRWHVSSELGSEEFACAYAEATPSSAKDDVLTFLKWTVFDGSAWIVDPAVCMMGIEVPYLEVGDCISKPLLKDMSGRHEAIYIGGHEVVDVAPSRGELEKITTLAEAKELFKPGGAPIAIVMRRPLIPLKGPKFVGNHGIREGSPYSRAEIVARAISCVGNSWLYDPLHHNCQSFANWCQTDRLESYQGEHIAAFFDHKKSWREVVYKCDTGSPTRDHVLYGAKIALHGLVVGVGTVTDFVRQHISPPRKDNKEAEKSNV